MDKTVARNKLTDFPRKLEEGYVGDGVTLSETGDFNLSSA
jgi:hypothetical protein